MLWCSGSPLGKGDSNTNTDRTTGPLLTEMAKGFPGEYKHHGYTTTMEGFPSQV